MWLSLMHCKVSLRITCKGQAATLLYFWLEGLVCDLSFEDSDISFCLSCSAYHGNCELPVLTTDPFLKIQSNNYSGLRRDDEEMMGLCGWHRGHVWSKAGHSLGHRGLLQVPLMWPDWISRNVGTKVKSDVPNLPSSQCSRCSHPSPLSIVFPSLRQSYGKDPLMFKCMP